MSMKTQISNELIEKFLEGYNEQKYIVGVEASPKDNFVSLIINDPELGKYIEKDTYKPFVWLKHKVSDILYNGNRTEIRKAMSKYGVTIKALKVENDKGEIPERIENGFKYIAECNGSYNDLIKFFKFGGVNIYSPDRLFFTLTPVEQYLIQTGKRLFKGFDDYDNLHKLTFDLETTGLDPKKNSIFQIGMKDNRGFDIVIEVKSEYEEELRRRNIEPNRDDKNIILQELRESEKNAIIRMFEIIDSLKPDVISGYNSENFDFDFIYQRCQILYISIEKFAKTLNNKENIFRKNSTLKLGQETEYYDQTYMWGYNIIDIMHAVRKAQAINSDIKKAGLKYITKFSKIAKTNRVYVDGDKIHSTWASFEKHYFNDKDGSWFKIKSEELSDDEIEKINSNDYEEVTGAYIVQRYLIDDLWETEQIDNIYNQATFLVSKILPTSYMRASTMGTAGTWKLIMSAWSYENNLAIPDYEAKREFTGGLSRLLRVGYAKDVVKLDFAALYPKCQLTNNIVPNLDISGVMPYLLTYVVDTRDKFKFLTSEEKDKVDELKKLLSDTDLTNEEIHELKNQIERHSKLSSDYDKKQLPLKILANSYFGSFGAPYIFPWGEISKAEETTCSGRQYLRMMVKFFYEKYNFIPLVLDTDGCNFSIPDNINEIKYICKATHWKTKQFEPNTELVGLQAVLAEFNETYMEGRMGLDIDDVCNSTINFARKNYANDIKGKIKFVGNSIKSKTMPVYIEEFLDKGIRLLLDGKGYEFIEYYYEYVEQIFNFQIPLSKIATKKRIKQTIDDYVNIYCKTKTTAGSLKSRQAHMELAILNNLNVSLGDTIYYVNVGQVKSHGDIKTIKDKNGKQQININCKLIPTEEIDNNPDLTTNEYNVARYLEAFNKKISSLLVCFHPEIRNKILIDVVKNKKTKVYNLEERPYFTRKQCILDSGNPNEPKDQDDYHLDLMKMEDKEIKFWSSVDKTPIGMDASEFELIVIDWKERMRIERINGIKHEKNLLDDLFKRLEIDEINQLKIDGVLNKFILNIADIKEHKTDGYYFYSNKYDAWLCPLTDLFKYENIAKLRSGFYDENPDLFKKIKRGFTKYDIWFDYENNKDLFNEETKIELEITHEIIQEEEDEWNF